ncbi:MAG: RNA polymerase sigma factor [Planctomycetia bacterium]|nr:RNA polymerase sigma factor [Planctomycetia bacterium]
MWPNEHPNLSETAQSSALDSGWPPAEEVIRTAQGGDRQGQRRLYDACRERVYRLAYRMIGPDDAADVSQQTFLQVFRNITQFAGQSRFETWLFRIVLNECFQLRRRRARRPAYSLCVDVMDHEPGQERSTDASDLLEMALLQLDPDLRSIFLLREIEHLGYEAIGEALGIPAGTVASRLNRARRELQGILIALGWEP